MSLLTHGLNRASVKMVLVETWYGAITWMCKIRCLYRYWNRRL